jgi:type VI secretion system protein ImpF
MTRKSKKPVQLRASILDRLIDLEPDKKTESEKSRHQFFSEIKESVRRDLETLLNTRFRCLSPPEACKELDCSLVNYGLPDLNVINFTSALGREQFCVFVEDNIRKFEPRFKSVRVMLSDQSQRLESAIRFRIEATMYADPAPEELIFDSSLEPVTNNVRIESML